MYRYFTIRNILHIYYSPVYFLWTFLIRRVYDLGTSDGIQERQGYIILKNTTCSYTYIGNASTFHDAEDLCLSKNCTHIKNFDCRRDEGFRACIPGLPLRSRFWPHGCVYEAIQEGNYSRPRGTYVSEKPPTSLPRKVSVILTCF